MEIQIDLTNEQVFQLWQKVFPNSMIITYKGLLSDGDYFKGKLAKDRSELANGISENDPLNYMFNIENGYYEEYYQSVFIKSDNSCMAYGRDRLRKKNIKNITADKLLARFKQIKELVVRNKANFINLEFNINDKV